MRKYKLIFIFIIIILQFSLFNNCVFADTATGANGKEYTYTDCTVTPDDGTPGRDLNGIKCQLTYYGGPNLGCGMIDGQDTDKYTWGTNSKYGWREVTEKGTNKTYCVFAGATHELIKERVNGHHSTVFFGWKFDHIHYFSYYDTFQFKFDSSIPGYNGDDSVYHGIILDSCNVSMWPQAPKGMNVYDGNQFCLYGDDYNELDIYYGADGESLPSQPVTSQVLILAEDDGTWDENDEGTIDGRKFWAELFGRFFSIVADAIQRALDRYALGEEVEGLTESFSTLYKYKTKDYKTSKDKEKKENKENNEEIEKDNYRETLDVERLIKGETIPKSENGIPQIKVKSKNEDAKGKKITFYDSSLEIPVFYVDAYSMSIGRGKGLDINFFDENKNQNKFWKILQWVVNLCSRVILYISLALLLIAILYKSIEYVVSIKSGNPEEAEFSKYIINSIIKSVFLIIFIFLLANLLIRLNAQVIKLLTNDSDRIYLMRVNIEEVYAFNTNPIGYVKYLSLSKDSDVYLRYSFLYFILEIFNGICFFYMFYRLLKMAFLIIIAPLTAVNNTLNIGPKGENMKSSVLNFNVWLSSFIRTLIAPLFVIIIYKILMVLL